MDILQKLFESGISASISTIAGQGFRVRIGNEQVISAASEVTTLDLAIKWLDVQARKFFPTSNYALQRTA